MSERDTPCKIEAERERLLRRLAYMLHGPGSLPKHRAGEPRPEVDAIRSRLKALDR